MKPCIHSFSKVLLFSLSLGICAVSAQAQVAQREPPPLIRKAGGVLQASATNRVEPEYPPLARAARISGAVVVEVTVDEEGAVIDARSISGHPLLKDAAVSAARQWKFSATRLEGAPVKVIGTITFNFVADPPEEETAQLRKLEREAAANPDSAELAHKLGMEYRKSFQEEKALEALKRAVQIKPDFAEAHGELGRLYHEIGRDEEALHCAYNILKIDASSKTAVYAHLLIGTINFMRDRFSDAIQSFKEALSIHSGSPDSEWDAAHTGLGFAYVKLGDKQAAMKEYEILRPRESMGQNSTKFLKGLIDAMP